jgi:ribosomal protein S27E
MIRFACPTCQAKITVQDDLAGRKGACGNCGQRLLIPKSPENKTSGGDLVPVARPHDTPEPKVVISRIDEIPEVIPVSQPRPSATPGPLKRPYLTRTAALINCPYCARELRIEEDHFNQDMPCRCTGRFQVVVSDEGYIPFFCPLCKAFLEYEDEYAGKRMRCEDCDGVLTVPATPLLVLRRLAPGKPPPSVQIEKSVLDRLITSPARPSRYSSGRTCRICGRFIRNPTGLCYKCQR